MSKVTYEVGDLIVIKSGEVAMLLENNMILIPRYFEAAKTHFAIIENLPAEYQLFNTFKLFEIPFGAQALFDLMLKVLGKEKIFPVYPKLTRLLK